MKEKVVEALTCLKNHLALTNEQDTLLLDYMKTSKEKNRKLKESIDYLLNENKMLNEKIDELEGKRFYEKFLIHEIRKILEDEKRN